LQQSQILDEFIQHCHKQLACYVFATTGFQRQLANFSDIPPGKRIFFGNGFPETVPPTAVLQIDDVKSYCETDGEFHDTIAKSVLVMIYTEWDEHFRQRIASDHSCRKNEVTCDLMGDLRLLRNIIVHERSNVAKSPAFKILDWDVKLGSFSVTSEMMNVLFEQLNGMTVVVSTKET
jgi:hypothetical protein